MTSKDAINSTHPNAPNINPPPPPYMFCVPSYAYHNGSFHMVPNYYIPPPPSPYNFGYNIPMIPNFSHMNYLQQPLAVNPHYSQNNVQEEFKYNCTSCDKGYRTKYKFDEHVSQHVKCPADDCTYSACESLVEFHYKWQHVTGLASKCWGKTPEEIEEWRNNRKKNFPTESKIIKKRAQKAKLALKYSASRKVYENQAQLTNCNSNTSGSQFPNYNTNLSNQQSKNNMHGYKHSPTQSSNQLCTAVTGYNNSSSVKNHEAWVPNETKSLARINESLHINQFNHNHCIKRFRERSLRYLAKAATHKLPLGTDTSQWRRKYTLLERLLAPEIKKERGLILKCIKFVSKQIIPSQPASILN